MGFGVGAQGQVWLQVIGADRLALGAQVFRQDAVDLAIAYQSDLHGHHQSM